MTKDFKTNYWQSIIFDEGKIYLTFGLTEAVIHPDGYMQITGGTIQVTQWYNLINEAMAVYIHYFKLKANEKLIKVV